MSDKPTKTRKNRFKQVEQEYKAKQEMEKAKIRQEPSRGKRFWKWVWYYIAFPWKWLWVNIRDWKTFIIFFVVCAVVSCEVWVPYLIGFITWGTELSKWMMGVGSTCWLFWLGPGTPFMVICIVLTIAVKGVFNKITEKNKDGERQD